MVTGFLQMPISKATACQSLKNKVLLLDRHLGTIETVSRNWASKKPA